MAVITIRVDDADTETLKRRLDGVLEGMRTRGLLSQRISTTAEIFYDDGVKYKDSGVKYITNESKHCQIPVIHAHGTGNCSPPN